MNKEVYVFTSDNGLVNHEVCKAKATALGPDATPVLKTECGAALVVTYNANERVLVSYCAGCGGVAYAFSIGTEAIVEVAEADVLTRDEVMEVVKRAAT